MRSDATPYRDAAGGEGGHRYVYYQLNPSKLVNFLNYAKHIENKATIGVSQSN
jgi:hypothetical protein